MANRRRGFTAINVHPGIIDMAGHAHALVTGTAATYQTQLRGQFIAVDANATGGGTSGQTLTLPDVAAFAGVELTIINAGGETITLSDVASTTIAADKTTKAISNGTYWFAGKLA
jgi:hypothetical protein